MLGLLVAGFVVLLGGLLAIGFGIPVKEFSFGNTLILTGALAACTGAILIALSLVLRELKAISLGLDQLPAGAQPGSDPFAVQTASLPRPGTASRAPELPPEEPLPWAETPPAPWQEQFLARERAETSEAAPQQEPAAKKRKNLLFMSSRRDREEVVIDAPPAVADSEEAADLEDAGGPATAEPRFSFDDSRRGISRQRTDAPRRPSRQSADVERQEARPAGARRSPEPAPVTIIKSGVVDGMAYSLYSDGSIEAEMPEGMIRFSSVDELRMHLERRA
jgi:hypothetical protein